MPQGGDLDDSTNRKSISKLEKQYALTKPTSPTTSLVFVDVIVSALHFPSTLAKPKDEEDWLIGSLDETEAEERVEAKRRLSNSQESCSAKTRMVTETVSKAVGLAVLQVDDAGDTVIWGEQC